MDKWGEQAVCPEAKAKEAGDPKARTQVTEVGPKTPLGHLLAPAALACAGAPHFPFSQDPPSPACCGRAHTAPR